MTRNEFVKVCSLLGIGIPFQSIISACNKKETNPINSNESILIIGAGAGGLSAGYLLGQQGVDFQILEASSRYGGRMKRTTEFADFPIPLGAEWLHVERGIFDEIVNDSNAQINVATVGYNHSEDVGLFEGIEISTSDIGFSIDQKFINSTWFDFFEEYVVPSVKSKIAFNKVVESIDYSGDQIIVKTASETFTADRVIVSVPVKILQNNAISFAPALPIDKQEAINSIKVWDGCKAFIEFKEKFYPTFVGFNITPESDGQKLYYDASYGQRSEKHILGLFAVGTGTLPYVNLSDSELIDYILAELDEIFEGKATENYVKHIFQNWNAEPFANGAYITDHENWRTVRTLGNSVANKVYFAGNAYTDGEDWSSVHTAARSAKRAIDELVG